MRQNGSVVKKSSKYSKFYFVHHCIVFSFRKKTVISIKSKILKLFCITAIDEQQTTFMTYNILINFIIEKENITWETDIYICFCDWISAWISSSFTSRCNDWINATGADRLRLDVLPKAILSCERVELIL